MSQTQTCFRGIKIISRHDRLLGLHQFVHNGLLVFPVLNLILQLVKLSLILTSTFKIFFKKLVFVLAYALRFSFLPFLCCFSSFLGSLLGNLNFLLDSDLLCFDRSLSMFNESTFSLEFKNSFINLIKFGLPIILSLNNFFGNFLLICGVFVILISSISFVLVDLLEFLLDFVFPGCAFFVHLSDKVFQQLLNLDSLLSDR